MSYLKKKWQGAKEAVMKLSGRVKVAMMPEYKVLVVGLQGVGKTAYVHRLLHGENAEELTPTPGMKPTFIERSNARFLMWDLGGALWQHWPSFYADVQGVIFVVDAGDRETIGEAREMLHQMMDEKELDKAAWLIVGNKQDVQDSMKTEELTLRLGLEELRGRKSWLVQETSAAPFAEFNVEDSFHQLCKKLKGEEAEEWS